MEMMKSILAIAVASLIAGSASAEQFPLRDGDFAPSENVFRDVLKQMSGKDEKLTLISNPRGHVSEVKGGGVTVPLMFKVSKNGRVSYQSAMFFVRKTKTGFVIVQMGDEYKSRRRALYSYVAMTKKGTQKDCSLTSSVSGIDMDNHAFTATSSPCDKIVW